MATTASTATTQLWRHPYPHLTQADAFRRYVNKKYGLQLNTYAQLHRWSVEDIEAFAREIWTFCGMRYSTAPSQVAVGLEKMYPRPEWFPGALMNYTENLLYAGIAVHPDAVAVSACREGGSDWRHLTWLQLMREVEKWASALRRAGIRKGDRIATVMTNSVECLVILLASAAIGAIFSSTSPDMGAAGIVERYGQLRPKLIFVDTQIFYGGKVLDLRSRISQAAAELHSLVDEFETTVVVSGPLFSGANVQDAASFLAGPIERLKFEQVHFDHPVYILYSSGTTGPPKCICHAGGGALLQQKKELMLSNDLRSTSTYYQYTTTGWMMWNYLVAGLSCGARVVLYDGSPLHPDPTVQLRLIKEQGVSHWGTSPKFLAALRQHGVGEKLELENLELVMTSGSPLSPEIYKWFYDKFPKRVGLFSGSGGTDLVGGIVMGTPLLPIHSGEISSAALGMKVEIWQVDGRNIEDTGDKGDLVITKPFFSMPITFWGESGEAKYKKAYFETFPGVWCHGDYIKKNPKTGGYEILGRSDGVLNPGGVRFGTAELYGVLDRFSEIEDCIAVGQRRAADLDEQVLMFVKMKRGKLDDDLRQRICNAIRKSLSPRHVPAYVSQVQGIPYTVNGKKIENVVRDIVSGKTPKVSGTAVNPECLGEYVQYASLRRQREGARL